MTPIQLGAGLLHLMNLSPTPVSMPQMRSESSDAVVESLAEAALAIISAADYADYAD